MLVIIRWCSLCFFIGKQKQQKYYEKPTAIWLEKKNTNRRIEHHHFATNWQQKCLHLALLNGQLSARISWPQKNDIERNVYVFIFLKFFFAAMNMAIYKQQWIHCWSFSSDNATLWAHGQRHTQSHRIFSGCVDFISVIIPVIFLCLFAHLLCLFVCISSKS